MKIVDLNVLLYATNRDSASHALAKSWWDEMLSGDEPIGIPWVVLLGFLRIATNDRVFPAALGAEQAMEIVDAWLGQPTVIPLSPGTHHWDILRDLLAGSGTAANLTTDAHLAALAIENGAELCSTDSDFGRFPRLRWTNPLAGRGG